MKKKSAAFDLDESIGHMLNHAAWAVRAAFESQLANHNVTAPQWTVLVCLWKEDDQTPSEICRRLFFDRPTMTGIIDRLETKSLVVRKRDSNDRRVVRIMLTKKGRELEQQLPAVAKAVDTHTLAGLSPENIEIFIHCLKRVIANFSQ